MRRPFLLPAWMFPLVLAAGCAHTGLINSGLEVTRPAGLPEGWMFRSSSQAGYRARVTGEEAYAGDRCVLIESVGTPRDPFGNLMQVLDAAPYRGRRIQFRAAVRADVADAGGAVQLWMRVDRRGDRIGFFDNMGDRPITAPEWNWYEIIGDVAEDATKLNLGVFLRGRGRVWFDAASVRVIAEAGAGNQAPRPLTQRGLENVVAFTRLLGYVRYFHPTQEAAGEDWDAFAIRGVQEVEGAQSADALAEVLERLFSPLAPSVQVFPDSLEEAPAAPHAVSPDDSLLAVWVHVGVGSEDPGSIYSSRRIETSAADERFGNRFPHPGEPLVASLGGGLSCSLPMVLPVEEVPPGRPAVRPEKFGKPAGFMPSGDDRTTRLAGVALAWNVFQHFYPYFDVVGVDWMRSLREALLSAATDRDERAYLDSLRRLVANLEDGHGAVLHRSDDAHAEIPILWDWVEDHLVVTQVGPGAEGLARGDVILEINECPVLDVLEAEERLISGATPQWRRVQALRLLRLGRRGEDRRLFLQKSDGTRSTAVLRLDRPPDGFHLVEPRPPQLHDIRSGIYYVDLGRISDRIFNEALPKLARARAIIFDLRGYPSVSTDVIAHLIDEPVRSAQWHVPEVTRPDQDRVAFQSSSWEVQPKAPRLTARVVFLTDARAISYAETYMGIIEHYHLGKIVGSPTAGTNGNVNAFRLPGGYRITWTGMKVLKHDGSRHHGIGIRPTLPVNRTLRGIREGRDEVLERAIEVLESQV